MPHKAQPGFRRSRSQLLGEARMRCAQGTWRAPLRDLSLSGLHVKRPADFPLREGEALEVELHCGPAYARVQPVVRASVARSDADVLGLTFENLSPMLERELQSLLATHGSLRDDDAHD
jgi:hypothetical protein